LLGVPNAVKVVDVVVLKDEEMCLSEAVIVEKEEVEVPKEVPKEVAVAIGGIMIGIKSRK
jgi:hypothetical protein